MAEKDYSALIAEAKAALDGYSAEQEAIARLYEQAKQNAQAAYDAQKQQLAQKTDADRNQAAVDMLRTEKNLDQTLASRGLAFSGENAQTRLDLSLALQGQLADIENSSREQEAAWDRESAEKLNGLDLEYAKYRADGAAKKASLQADLAGVQAQQEAAQAAAKQVSDASQAGDGKDVETETQKPEVELPFHANSTILKLLEQKYKDAVNKASGTEQAASAEGGMTPSVSARDLAKQMVSAVGGSGRVSGYTQQSKMKQLLETVQQENQLDSAYYRELLLNLQSMGYQADYAEQLDVGAEALQETASEMFGTFYSRYYSAYRNAGYDVEESDRLAGEAALFEQMAYLYANSESKDLFERAVIGLGLSGNLESFYEKIAEKNQEHAGSYALGSALEK